MKKFSILLLSAFAMAVTSCDEAPEVPPMQSNPQEPILEAGDITGHAVGALASTSVLNLETAGTTVEVFAFTQVEDIPAGATVFPTLELSNTEDFAKTETISLVYNEVDSVFVADTEVWNTAHLALFGKSPKEKTAYYRLPVYISYGGTDYRYQSPDYYAATGTIEETCMDAGFTIASAYYIIGDMNGWNLSTQGLADYQFSHGTADVYDDPVFTITVSVPDDCYWKIAPVDAVEASNWDGLFGPETDGDTAMEGMLYEITEGGQAGKIETAGLYKFTINMEAMTYTITPVMYAEYLYTPGVSNDWNIENSQKLYSTEDGNYYGYAHLKDSFKFTDAPDWNHGNYGAGAEAGTLQQGSNDNLPVEADGLYWIHVNTDDLTYELTPITTIGIIGGFEDNSWSTDVATLTPSEDFLTWTATVTYTAGVTWKFRMNEGWDVNLGGSLDDLTQNGSDLSTAEAGTYTVTLNLANLPYSATMVKK